MRAEDAVILRRHPPRRRCLSVFSYRIRLDQACEAGDRHCSAQPPLRPYATRPARSQFTCFTGTKLQILTQKALLDALKIPLIKRSSKGVYVEDPKSDKYRHGVDHVPVVMSDSRTAFLANISIGSPRQPFTVLLDTGLSSVCVCVSACACVCACACACV